MTEDKINELIVNLCEEKCDLPWLISTITKNVQEMFARQIKKDYVLDPTRCQEITAINAAIAINVDLEAKRLIAETFDLYLDVDKPLPNVGLFIGDKLSTVVISAFVINLFLAKIGEIK